jgi:hypothetical protein
VKQHVGREDLPAVPVPSGHRGRRHEESSCSRVR